MNKVKRFLIGATAGAVMLGSMASPVFAGSLFHPQSDAGAALVDVCQSTTANGDAVTNTAVSGLETFTSENCT